MTSQTTPDPVDEDARRARRHPLAFFFAPRSMAVVGASDRPGSVGRALVQNLLIGPTSSTLFFVNHAHANVAGLPAYASISAIPRQLDLAVIATPAPTVPEVVRQCADAGVGGAIIVSAGFREQGPEGAALERRALEEARRGRMRLIGPNCLGLMRPPTGLNASFASRLATPGHVAFLSQSGALCTAILDWSVEQHVGFSAFVSVGSMVDIGWGDLIDYLGDDPRTHSIVLYMESIGDARFFMSAAREVALTKPIIVLKAGRTAAAAHAAASHTGSLAGSDVVLDAAFRRCGALRVRTIADLFALADALAKQPRPRGPKLAIITNAGGPGVLATDALIEEGGELAALAEETRTALDAVLPPHWSHGNPIDLLGDAGPERYAAALDAAARDATSDGVLAILTPQAMTDPRKTAERLAAYARTTGKPVLASWMGGADVAAGEAVLSDAGIPVLPYPDTAARTFTLMWRSAYNLLGLYETPAPLEENGGTPDRARVAGLIASARDAGRTLLTECESKWLLAAYGMPTTPCAVAATADEAAQLSEAMGYPVVLKLHSTTVTHKTDVGGVRLDLRGPEDVRVAFREIEAAARTRAGIAPIEGVTVQPMVVRQGYELIVGSTTDPQFGPVLLCGLGGQLVEVFQDRALGLPPLTTTLARRMLEQTRVYRALRGVRGRPPVDLAALEALLVRFSYLVVEQPLIQEIDVNPLLASSEGMLALDARIVLVAPEADTATLPRPAIRPYPTRYVSPWRLGNGTAVTIRPIRPDDEPLMVAFHRTLSERSVYLRYFSLLGLDTRTAHDRLQRMCFIDYDRAMALVAERHDPAMGERAILGVGRLVKAHARPEAEFALLVSDQVQHQGLGTELLRRLIGVGRDEGLHQIVGDILPDNDAMLNVCAELGFRLTRRLGEPVKVELDLERR